MTPLIELRGIGKRYGTGEAAFVALHDIDLTINEGEFVAIMGPSGSGKSTVMNIIGALDRPSWGEYLFSGLHVEKLSTDERALLRRKFLGFVFQGFNLLARTTALENVELPLLYRRSGILSGGSRSGWAGRSAGSLRRSSAVRSFFLWEWSWAGFFILAAAGFWPRPGFSWSVFRNGFLRPIGSLQACF